MLEVPLLFLLTIWYKLAGYIHLYYETSFETKKKVKTVFMVSMTIINPFCFDGSPKYNGMQSDSV